MKQTEEHIDSTSKAFEQRPLIHPSHTGSNLELSVLPEGAWQRATTPTVDFYPTAQPLADNRNDDEHLFRSYLEKVVQDLLSHPILKTWCHHICGEQRLVLKAPSIKREKESKNSQASLCVYCRSYDFWDAQICPVWPPSSPGQCVVWSLDVLFASRRARLWMEALDHPGGQHNSRGAASSFISCGSTMWANRSVLNKDSTTVTPKTYWKLFN